MRRVILLVLACLSLFACQNKIEYGIDRETEFAPLIKDKNVAIVVNHTSRNGSGEHLFSIVQKHAKLAAIFAPEHGFLGDHAAGEHVKDDLSKKVFSLHGKHKKPQPEQLKNVDIILYDIQDVGTRFYTYISTLGLVMQAAAEQRIPVVVLDRPIYLGGNRVEGNALDTAFASFIGKYPIPSTYGLTIGELALMIKGEGWLGDMSELDLQIIKLTHWQRDALELTDARFIAPSPNIPDIETIYFYSALCFLEGTNASEARGIAAPFRTFGAPWLDQDAFLAYFNATYNFPVKFTKTKYVPRTIKGKAYKPKFEDKTCYGFELSLLDKETFNGFDFGMAVLHTLAKTQDAFLVDRQRHFNWLFGADVPLELLKKKQSVDDFLSRAKRAAKAFEKRRAPYVLY